MKFINLSGNHSYCIRPIHVLSTSCPSDFNVGSAGFSEVATVEVLSGSTGDESEDRAWAPLELEAYWYFT